jgi:hypothetical protein
MDNMHDILARFSLLESKGSKPDFLDINKDGDRKEPMKKAAKEVDEAIEEGNDIQEPRHPQALDYQSGPEDDEQYRAHHGLDDLDRRRERKLRATDYKTLDRLERQAVNRAKQIDEEPNEGNEFSGELAKAKATGAKEFKVDGRTYPVKESVKSGIRLIKEHTVGDRSVKIYHDDAYDEFTVCMTQGESVTRVFAEDQVQALAAVKTWLSEGRNDPSPLDDPLTRFRKKHAPSVMRDPKGREELSKLDTEYGERKKTAYGRGEDEDEDEEGAKKDKPAGEKRGRGRPRKYSADKPRQERVTARSRKKDRTSWSADRKKMREDGILEDYDEDEYDEEGEMAMSQARTIEDAAEELQSILDADENLPEWVQKKISMAKEYIDTARDYLKANRPEDDMAMAEASTGDYSAKKARAGKDIGKPGKQFAKIAKSAGERYGSKERGEKVAGAVLAKLRAKEGAGEELEEKAVSKAQRKAAGIAYAARKGEIPKSELRGASKEMAKMAGGELKKFAKTKEKDLPAKKEESVEETTTAGNVATAGDAPKSNKGGMQFGKGVYEARLAEEFRKAMESVVTENLDVSVNANADGTNTVSVTGKNVEPDVLMDLLTMAGMAGQRQEVYMPVDSEPSQNDMSGMLSALDSISQQEQPDTDEPMAVPESDMCEVCGAHEGMHEAGCSRSMAMEQDLANSADNTTMMDTDYMTQELAGGLNGPKLQSNPNNMGDNPLAMKNLGKTASPNLNLGAVAEDIEQKLENRLLDLYRKIQ